MTRYEPMGLLGTGGQGRVYLVRDPDLDKKWAMKLVKKSQEGTIPPALQLIKGLSHPLLPRLVELVDRGSYWGVIFDFIEGESLDRSLERGVRWPEETVCRWGIALADVLSYLHQQDPPLIYGDLKPANLMREPSGALKLIDFGLIERRGQKGRTVGCGSPDFAAPEQFAHRPVTERTDVYGLGRTLWALVGGDPKNARKGAATPISRAFQAVLDRACQPEAEARFPSMAAMGEALLAVDQQWTSAGWDRASRLWAINRKQKTLQKSKGRAFLLLGLLFGLALVLWGQGRQETDLARLAYELSEALADGSISDLERQALDQALAEKKEVEQGAGWGRFYLKLGRALLVSGPWASLHPGDQLAEAAPYLQRGLALLAKEGQVAEGGIVLWIHLFDFYRTGFAFLQGTRMDPGDLGRWQERFFQDLIAVRKCPPEEQVRYYRILAILFYDHRRLFEETDHKSQGQRLLQELKRGIGQLPEAGALQSEKAQAQAALVLLEKAMSRQSERERKEP